MLWYRNAKFSKFGISILPIKSSKSISMKKKTFKNRLHQLHLYLGMITGLVVFIMAITGCGWVFHEEITGLYEDFKTVTPENKPMITVTQATDVAKTIFPDKHIHGVLFGATDEAVEVIFYESEPEFYQSVFLNPYDGEVIHVKNHFSGFFYFMIDGHVNLWLPKEIGSRVTSYSTLIFLFILLSGLVLWMPKKRKNLEQRIKFDWKSTTSWKRKNWDLHAITGFYTFSLALLLGFTGCVMAFNWFYYITYKAVGGQKNPRFVIPANEGNAKLVSNSAILPIDKLIPKLKKEYPQALSFEVHTPDTDTSSIYVEVSYQNGVYYNSDYRFYDQYSLKEIPSGSIYSAYENATFSEKVIRMNYDIHVGAIGGLFGKIIAFLASLSVASLPLSGFLIWWGRRYKGIRGRD